LFFAARVGNLESPIAGKSDKLEAGSYKLPLRSKPAKKTPLDEAGLYDYAIKALGRHMRTEAELRRLMASRVAPGASGETAIATVVRRLKEHGYLNDAAYAETYARLRQENEKLGARRVRQNLRQKGLRSDVIEKTIAAGYSATNEEALAREHLSRKRIPKPESPKEAARVMRRLVAAGFSTGVIYKILRQWDVPDEELATLDSLDADSHED
jgi:regulatory protein